MARMATVLQCTSLLLFLLAGVCGSTVESHSSRFKRSDDIQPLETVVAHQGQLIQTLQAQLQALKDETTAMKARQQKLSTQVAFFVRFGSDPSKAGIPLTTHSTLKFDRVITNIGNGYDAASGIFTAPVAGSYAFFVTTMSVNGQSPVEVDITKHGVVVDRVFAEGGSDNYDQGSTLLTIHLGAREQVWVQQAHGNTTRGGFWTVFTGYLLQAD